MRKFTSNHKRLLSILSVSLLMGCGASSNNVDNGSNNASSNAGNSGSELANDSTWLEGPITAFGSIFVDGVHIDIDSARLTLDDSEIDKDNLEIGMMVGVLARMNSNGLAAVASAIEADEELKGPISSIDVAGNTIGVLGQNVLIDETTAFINTSLEQLNVGDKVKISGLINAEGQLVATRVKLQENDQDTTVEVEGTIGELDLMALSFKINDLVVDYSNANLRKFDEDMLKDGLVVEVKGSLNEDGILLASLVKNENGDDNNGEGGRPNKRKFVGLVTEVIAADTFTVKNYTVKINDNTEIQQDALGGIALNRRVKVAGELDEEGVVIASSIRFMPMPSTQLKGEVEAVDVANNTITVLQTIVYITPDTIWRDNSKVKDKFIDIAALEIGNLLKVKGALNNEGNFTAISIQRKNKEDDDDEAERELEGKVTDIVVGESFKIMDVLVIVNTETRFFEKGQLTLEQFFTALKEDDVVEVEGQEGAEGEIVASKVKIEKEDDEQDDDVEGPISDIVPKQSFKIAEVAISVNDETMYYLDEQVDADTFFAAIKDGDIVEVEGEMPAENEMLARIVKLKLEDDDDDNGKPLKGVVTEIDMGVSITVGDVLVNLNSETRFLNKGPITLESFFQVVSVGDEVKVKGSMSDENEIAATWVKLENNNKSKDD